MAPAPASAKEAQRWCSVNGRMVHLHGRRQAEVCLPRHLLLLLGANRLAAPCPELLRTVGRTLGAGHEAAGHAGKVARASSTSTAATTPALTTAKAIQEVDEVLSEVVSTNKKVFKTIDELLNFLGLSDQWTQARALHEQSSAPITMEFAPNRNEGPLREGVAVGPAVDLPFWALSIGGPRVNDIPCSIMDLKALREGLGDLLLRFQHAGGNLRGYADMSVSV